MRSAGEILIALVETGLSAEQKALLLELAALATLPAIADDHAKAATRRDRNRRYYESRKLNKASETSETGLNKTTESATETSETKTIKTPLARVEDNLPRLVDTCRTDDDEDASAWDRARLDGLAERLRLEAGEALNAAAPDLLNLSPIVKLLKGGEGPRCELEADVVPAVRVVAAKARRGSIRTWGYFRQAIVESRDQRLTGAPTVVAVDFTARAQGPPAGSYAAVEAEQAAIRTEVRRRLLESP